MSKGNSHLFKGTTGYYYSLAEDTVERYLPSGKKVIDFDKLPGLTGIKLQKRLTDEQMTFLTNEYGVEFAQVYELGAGKNGRGGQYRLYSGIVNRVEIPVTSKTILINHTHPGGTQHPSKADLKLLALIMQVGSPQRTSAIIPVGKSSIKYTLKGVKK